MSRQASEATVTRAAISVVDRLAAQNAALIVALRRLAIKQYVRLTYEGGHVNSGKGCVVCRGEWADDAPEFHASTCPLDGTAPVKVTADAERLK